ncbi:MULTISPECIES: ABC transporter permease [unclassified Sphingomonas]|uniref:ABC transporter permease n=1 Tax=unclassified Sphingomonas TaxID=196159 RepID=UPI001D0FCF7F|nr:MULTISPECIES: ABC transporter permease [unclassified Sphingomonas]MCC2978676.1 ABC transporter permease [Sphingomonas sp. IC4-52]MCD2316037.1 ABC transporter permease [Sphingomonas sp. IC-11]
MASVSEDLRSQPGVMRKGLRIQSRVIGALMMRELHTRYGRENIGYLWLILEPLFLATAVGLIHARSPNHFGGDIKPVPAALIGYCNFMTFRSMVSRAEGVLENNVSLFYHRTITPFDVLLSRGLLEQAGTLVAFCLLMGVAMATGIANPPERPLIYVAGVAALFLLSWGTSMVVCAITHERRTLGRVIHPLIYVLMPLSGAFFTMHALPKQVRDVLLSIPLAHCYEMMRYGWFKSAKSVYIDLAYLGGWILGLILLGLLLLSVTRKRIHMP